MWKFRSAELLTTTRLFSNKYQSMLAPDILPSGAKLIRMNLPNRLELLFRCVCALPKASKIGFACMICRSRSPRRSLAVKELLDPVTDIDFFRNEDFLGNPVMWTEEVLACVPRGGASVAMAERYCMTFFVLSVFPAPDSPLIHETIVR